MFELIVLAVTLTGLAAIARAPVPPHSAESATRLVASLWSVQTDWRHLDRPTYLRRGVVLDGGANPSNPVRGRRCPSGARTGRLFIGEAP